MSLPATLCVLILAMFLLYRLIGSLSVLLQGVRRIRFLLLSIAILYIGFTPGRVIVPTLSWLTIEGIELALYRCGLLVLLLSLVYSVTQTTSSREMAAALRWLLQPFSLLGLDTDRQAIRVAMVFDRVPNLQAELAAKSSKHGTILDQAAQILGEIESSADHEPASDTALLGLKSDPIPQWQWLIPLLIVLGFWALHQSIAWVGYFE